MFLFSAGRFTTWLWATIAGLTAVGVSGPVTPVDAQSLPMHLSTPAPYAATVGAHARYSKVRINLAPPDLALLAAVVRSGGGAGTFDARTMVVALGADVAGGGNELEALTKRFGADNVGAFITTSDYFFHDALAQAAAAGVTVPPAPVVRGKTLVSELYDAGVPPHGAFDVEYMLDTLVSHINHVAVMNDIDADQKLGPRLDANFHSVLTQLMADLRNAYK